MAKTWWRRVKSNPQTRQNRQNNFSAIKPEYNGDDQLAGVKPNMFGELRQLTKRLLTKIVLTSNSGRNLGTTISDVTLSNGLVVTEIAISAYREDYDSDGGDGGDGCDESERVRCRCCHTNWAKDDTSALCGYCQHLAPFSPLTIIFDDVDVSDECGDGIDPRIVEINAIKHENEEIRQRHMQRKLNWQRLRHRIEYDDSNIIHAEHLFVRRCGDARVNLTATLTDA
jgi:hypothetical protein